MLDFMIALGLEGAEELGESFYLSYLTVSHRAGPLWHDMRPKDRRRWIDAAERVIRLYPAEGLTLGSSPALDSGISESGT